MIDQHKVALFKELLQQAESVLVVYAPDALRDHLFAATALYKSLQQLGTKDVALLSSEDLSKDESDIAYLSETKTEIGRKNLCITLDYTTDAVEKITSAIDENIQKLHITIKPKKGQTPLSKENVSFSYTGADADMVILVGVDDLESLDQIYIGYENLYQSTALVSINSYETSFGNLKLDIQNSSSVSEYVTELLKTLEYQLDQEVATNLLAGIDEETENLESYLATADTFEMVSYLLRSGARRFARSKKESEPDNSEMKIFETDPNMDSSAGFDSDDDVLVVDSEADEQNLQFANKQPFQPLKPSKSITQPQNITTFAAQLAERQKKKLQTQEKLNPFEKLLQKSNQNTKRGRGRPKGSLNRISSRTNKQITNKQTENKQSTGNKPKPGDLGFNPSGFGPSAV